MLLQHGVQSKQPHTHTHMHVHAHAHARHTHIRTHMHMCAQVIPGVQMGGIMAAVDEVEANRLPADSFKFFSG